MGKSSTKAKVETLQGWLIQLARGNKSTRVVKKRIEE